MLSHRFDWVPFITKLFGRESSLLWWTGNDLSRSAIGLNSYIEALEESEINVNSATSAYSDSIDGSESVYSLNPIPAFVSFLSSFNSIRFINRYPAIETSIDEKTHTSVHYPPLSVGSHLIPHDDKKEKGGEDAWFISEDNNTIGVFDGVGGWATSGIDPREYSHHLSLQCKYAVDHKSKIHPLQILRYGYDSSLEIMGSSTACIISIIENQFISANLGDSGFRIIRSGEIILSSISQQHRFNTPYQLGTQSDDVPEKADIKQLTLKQGDYIVLGTDGLFDNLYDSDILKVISDAPEESTLENMAQAIALKAYEVSKLLQVNIPFNDMAESYYGTPYWDNGKQDDITVIVARYDGS